MPRTRREYAWLLSDYHADAWELRDPDRSPKDSCWIHFHVRLPGGSLLTDPQHANLLATIRQVIVGMRVGHGTQRSMTTSAKTQQRTANTLFALVRWMLRNDIERFDRLSPFDFERFKTGVTDGVEGLFSPIAQLRQRAAEYRSSGHLPPTYGDGNQTFLRRRRFTEEAGLGRGSLPEISYELSRIAVEEFGLDLEPKDRRRFQQGPPERRPLTAAGLFGYFRAWDYLWKFGSGGEDTLTFQPFKRGEYTRTVNALGREGERTRTIPAHRAMFLIDRSIRWVIDYADELLQLRDLVMEAEGQINENPRGVSGERIHELRRHRRKRILESFTPTKRGPGDPWPLSPGLNVRIDSERPNLQQVVNRFLPAACMIVICTFSARRHEEVTLLQASEQPNLDAIVGEVGERFLIVWIEKTLQEWDHVPVPEIVVRAVDVLKRWSAVARERSGSPRLFQYPAWIQDNAHDFSSGTAVAEFANFLQATEPAEPWRLAPHQLRRFFALVYFHRYEHGDLGVLAQLLRHTSLEMTRVYVSETALGDVFNDVGTQRTVEALSAFAERKRKAGGGFATRFRAEIDRLLDDLRQELEARTEVIQEHHVERKVRQYVEDTGIMLKPVEWGECACRNMPEDTAQAKCRLGVKLNGFLGPDPATATPSVCAGCPHHFTGPQYARCWDQSLAKLKAAGAESNAPILRESSQARYHHTRKFANENVFLEEGEHAGA